MRQEGMMTMTNGKKKKITRILGKEYCTLEVEIREGEDGFKVLSICGTAGEVYTHRSARKMAREYWETFFEDQPEEIQSMNKRCGTNFRSPKSAAKYVIDTDGEYHGIDVSMERNEEVFVAHSCGQIREELRRFFPEVTPLFKYHLNDMHAGCEHQEALGWGHGRDIALSKDDLTPAQRAELERQAEAQAEKEREKNFEKRLRLIQTDVRYAREVLKGALKRDIITIADDEDLRRAFGLAPMGAALALKKKVETYLRELIASAYPAAPIESKVYKDSISAPCPTCGYRYGTKWLRRELPVEVIAWYDSDLEDTKLEEAVQSARR